MKKKDILKMRNTEEILHRMKKWIKRMQAVSKSKHFKRIARRQENNSDDAEVALCFQGVIECFNDYFRLTTRVRKGDR